MFNKISVTMMQLIEEKLKALIEDHPTGGHDYEHFAIVRNHALKALEYEHDLNKCQHLQVELAAFLHDADDTKIFPYSKNYENARKILNESLPDVVEGLEKQIFIDNVIQMIALVSCSKNGDSEPPFPWMAIPRDCDRLEAIGHIGIKRCMEYNNSIGRPFHVDTTIRVTSFDDVWKVAVPERFISYQNGAKSKSMIDHYYDKLLHIGNPDRLKSQNKYILDEAQKRAEIMVEYIINYWKQN